MANLEKPELEQLTINTIRTLSMDAVQKADSGHPGTPMALAPLAYVLWKRHLQFNPKNPSWWNRDRFVLSNGHASMLQYSILHLTGYDISLNDLKQFRQWGSITPGHPEYGMTPGIETTTGPLGQGIMNGVGMAIAEAHLAARYNREEHNIIDHYTYVFCGDGDFMEGASHEAAGIAGHLGLEKLIVFYDDNHITIEGKTEISYSDDVAARFTSYGWHVQNLGEKANDIEAMALSIEQAQQEKGRPSLIMIRSHIGFGSPNKQDTPDAHGSPLGEQEIEQTKKVYGWPEKEKFLVPEEVRDHMRERATEGEKLENDWNKKYEKYKKAHPELAQQLEDAMENKLPSDWDSDIPFFSPSQGPVATRKASEKVLNSFAQKLHWLVGGSGDLAPSTNTLIEQSGYFRKGNYANRNFAWGIREHGMCGASSGIALHGGMRPFAATFFIFTDYARPSIRLASLMELPVIYVMTHDSIGLGEDGPTHQPVEHLASLRAMPNLSLIRPADANETAHAWRAAIEKTDGPTMLVLTRQKLPVLDRSIVASAEGVRKGAYILSKEQGETPDLILMGSGSEVQLLIEAQKKLAEEQINARVVSFPSWDLFRSQPQEYREQVLPPKVRARVCVEAAHPQGWGEWVGDCGEMVGVNCFGASAPYNENFKHYGFTLDHVIINAKKSLANTERRNGGTS